MDLCEFDVVNENMEIVLERLKGAIKDIILGYLKTSELSLKKIFIFIIGTIEY